VLTQWGYDVTATGDGDEAWAALQENESPCLAVLDWEMPGIDGADKSFRSAGGSRLCF